ncbi:enoyl-CoA hydratase-related protein [Paraburkholderia phenoliruptrix]|uniref:enoyl-CoA hydratase-related protein n=1 Tax=Paraburkholderia phenoliruptrix TaxID=252970 RepID=UPI003D973D0A
MGYRGSRQLRASRTSVADIRVGRLECRNAVSLEVKRQLDEAFVAAQADPDVRMIVLTGGESCFVGGTDIGERPHMTSGEHAASDTGRVPRAPALAPALARINRGHAAVRSSGSIERPDVATCIPRLPFSHCAFRRRRLRSLLQMPVVFCCERLNSRR